MAEADFTRKFKDALAERVSATFKGVVRCDVGSETRPLPQWIGKPDIWVLDYESPGVWIFEIEYISNNLQIMKNILQVARFQQSKLPRDRLKIALIHLINRKSKLTREIRAIISDIEELADMAEYRFMEYDPIPGRPVVTAELVFEKIRPDIADIFRWMQS